jgi:CubicO group peptidase (beta-lactamase class C family)
LEETGDMISLLPIIASLCWLTGEPADHGSGNSWETTSPEAVGIDSSRLALAFAFLEKERVPIHTLTIVRHGRVVLDVAFEPFPRGGRHDIASCSKSVSALLVGLAIADGKIKGTDSLLVDLFPNRTIANRNDRKGRLKLRDILTMRSGLFCIQDALSQIQMFQSPDWVQFCLDLPCAREPGSTFQYFSLNSHLLSAAVQSAYGRSAFDLARERLFAPIGIHDAQWPADPQGTTRGWGDLRLTSLDLARLGLLMLQRGRWGDQQILPATWIDEMTSPLAPTGRSNQFKSYGYQTWVTDNSAVFKGRGGQRLFMIPSQDLIVVTTAGASDDQEIAIDRLVPEFVLPAVISPQPLSENPEALARLRTLPIPTPTVAEPTSTPLPLSGNRYVMDPNFYLREFQISWTGSETLRFKMSLPEVHGVDDLTFDVGMDGKQRIAPGRYGEPAALRGRWDNNKLIIDFDELGNINHWTITLEFEADTVQMTMSEVTDLPTVKVRGKRAYD